VIVTVGVVPPEVTVMPNQSTEEVFFPS